MFVLGCTIDPLAVGGRCGCCRRRWRWWRFRHCRTRGRICRRAWRRANIATRFPHALAGAFAVYLALVAPRRPRARVTVVLLDLLLPIVLLLHLCEYWVRRMVVHTGAEVAHIFVHCSIGPSRYACTRTCVCTHSHQKFFLSFLVVGIIESVLPCLSAFRSLAVRSDSQRLLRAELHVVDLARCKQRRWCEIGEIVNTRRQERQATAYLPTRDAVSRCFHHFGPAMTSGRDL